MAAAKKRNSKAGQPPVDYYKAMIGKFHEYLDAKTPAERKKALTLWSIIATVLLAASVVPLPTDFRVLSALVGTPAGVIFWFIFAGLFRETSLSQGRLAGLKERYSYRSRKRIVLIGGAVVIVAAVFTSPYIPYGLGGVAAVIIVMFCFYFLSRTDEEKRLDEYGLPDPRDDAEFYEDYDPELDVDGEFEDYEQPEADDKG